MMRNLLTVLSVLAVLAGGLALTFVSPVPLPRSIEVIPPVETKLVCASMAANGTLYFEGATFQSPLGEDDTSATAGPTLVEELQEPVAIRGGAGISGGSIVAAEGSRAYVPCQAPRSTGFVVVPGTATTDLLIVNPDASEAVVDLTLHGVDGEIVALGSRGIAVGPYSSRVIALAVLVPSEGPVGVEYRATRGRAAVLARTDSPGVLEAAAASALGREHLLAGIPQGATSASVLITNPGNERAEVDVTAFGASLAYTPEGGAAIPVPPHATVAVELAASLAGEATGLQVTSNADVAVALTTTTATDPAHAVPVEAATSLGVFVAAGGVLQLSNPGSMEATATVVTGVVDEEPITNEVTIPAGATQVLPLSAVAARGQSVSVTSDVPLFGSVVDVVDGTSMIALASLEVPVVEPLDAEIVPTLR